VPELSEVRWLKGNLQKELVGVDLWSGELLHQKLLEVTPGDTRTLGEKDRSWKELFKSPHTVVSVSRRGKFTVLNFNPQLTLLVHLSFTGWLIPMWAVNYQPRRFLHPIDPNKYTRLYLDSPKGRFCWSDPRALSRTRVFESEEEALESRHLKNMGPDADTPEAQTILFRAILKQNLIQSGPGFSCLSAPLPGRRSRRRIRDLLLDQKVVAGLGNYLVAEVLHRAKLHGAERVCDLTVDQVLLLYQHIRGVVTMAEINDDTSWWKVFRRAGETCPSCKEGVILRKAYGKRGFYYCPVCQPLREELQPVSSPS